MFLSFEFIKFKIIEIIVNESKVELKVIIILIFFLWLIFIIGNYYMGVINLYVLYKCYF